MAQLVGATALVDSRVLRMGEQVVARAGYQVGVVASGYRPGSRTVRGTTSLHAHRPSLAIDLAASGAKLVHLGQAALQLLGVPNPPTRFAGSVGGWEVAYGGDFPGWGDHTTHLHLGLEGVASGTQPTLPGVPAPGQRYDFHSLMLLWVGAGGNRAQAAMAAQVALLESGGRPNARLKTPREDSRGLWQINVKAHPQYATQNLYDPRVNVQAAITISGNGRNWGPWSTASAARAALLVRGPVTPPSVTRPGGGGSPFPPGLGAIGGAAGAVAGVVGSGADAVWGELRGVVEWGTAFIKLIGFLIDPKNWLRLVEFTFGFSLILLGLGVLVTEFAKRDTLTGKAAGAALDIGTKVTPMGRRFRRFARSTGQTRSVRDRALARKMRPTPVYSRRKADGSRGGPTDEIPF